MVYYWWHHNQCT